MYLGAPWCPLTWIKENCSVFEKEVTTVHSAWVQKKGQTWWCIVPEVSSRRSLLAGARESNLSREWEKKPRLVFVLDLNQTLAIHLDQQPTVLTHLLKAYLFHIYRYFFCDQRHKSKHVFQIYIVTHRLELNLNPVNAFRQIEFWLKLCDTDFIPHWYLSHLLLIPGQWSYPLFSVHEAASHSYERGARESRGGLITVYHGCCLNFT